MIKINNIAELRTRLGIDGSIVSVLGYYSNGDGGGGSFYWDNTSTETDNGGTIISVSTVGTGRWKRLINNQINVKWFGAKGDGINDDTLLIQKALDSEGLGSIFFPNGIYKVTGSGESCLYLYKNRNLLGEGRASSIRADFVSTSTSILKIEITDNGGYLDCRRLNIEKISMFHNGGGLHGLLIKNGMPILDATFSSITVSAGTNDAGYGIYVYNQLAHSLIESCEFDSAFMKCYDANVINKCLTFGKKTAITFDCEDGVRNNIVSNCTLVNRDGQVYILNGDNIRIVNNQMELAQSYTPSQNQSETSSMVYLKGIDRQISNIVIDSNNFGGGTNLNNSIYIDNATRTVISKNNFVATNNTEVYFTANSKYNIIENNNQVIGTLLNPRTNTFFREIVVDYGEGNIGVKQSGSKLNPQNNWIVPDFYKDSNGIVHFLGDFNGGIAAVDTVIGTLPLGFRPFAWTNYVASAYLGLGFIEISTNGVIKIKSLPSNSGVIISDFTATKKYL